MSLHGRSGGLEDGVNYVSARCAVGADTSVNSGETYKVAKDPGVSGEVVLDREATSADRGRFFQVNSGGTLEVTGLTLTGGYAVRGL